MHNLPTDHYQIPTSLPLLQDLVILLRIEVPNLHISIFPILDAVVDV
jgi:hypothetical protein